jgi:hypothetical protein
MNYYVADNLRFLTEYGPRYLTPEELRARLEERLVSYYKFLSKSALQRRGSEFWEYHSKALEQSGQPLSRMRLATAVAGQVLDKLLNPKRTIENLLAS